jgi:hypothetical protein
MPLPMYPLLVPLLAVVFATFTAAPAHAETIGGNPGPAHNYVCPHADGKPPLDCYLDAVEHLYKMCVNVKSIEIIEFGYEKSTEGTNGAKSDSCLDKQKQNIATPYKAALREVAKSKPTVDALHGLQETWLAAMNDLKWHAGESDSEYKLRVAKPYDDFSRRIATIRSEIAAAQAAAQAKKPVAKARAKPVAKAHRAAKPKTAAKAGATSDAGKH